MKIFIENAIMKIHHEIISLFVKKRAVKFDLKRHGVFDKAKITENVSKDVRHS